MTRLTVLVTVVTFVFLSATMSAQPCAGTAAIRVGGQLLMMAPALGGPSEPPGMAVSYIDINRPAPARVSADTAYFEYLFASNQAVTFQFASMVPSGTTYAVRNASAAFPVMPAGLLPGFAVELRAEGLQPPLVFEPGDVLAVIVTPSASQSADLPVNSGSASPGVLIALSDVVKSGPLQIFFNPYVSFQGGATMGAYAQGTANCSQLHDPEVLVPIAGDITGRAHYTTDVSVYGSGELRGAGGLPLRWTVRDRLQNPSAPTLITGEATIPAQRSFGDAVGSVTGLPPSYLGPMTISFPGRGLLYATNRSARLSDDAIVTARIAAQTPLGETGSSVKAVSCDQIGHTIAVPFHRTANQRVNIGVASAQLNSCGVFAAARSVIMLVGSGTEVSFAMPAESMQIDDITGTGSLLPDATGLTDGVVRVTVTDEASRIVAYASILDNTSQASTITVGRVER